MALFIYGALFNAKKDPILYRETHNATILNQADKDIRQFSKNNFTSKYALIITFNKVPAFAGYGTYEKQTFQAVISTDYSKTYVILNYVKLTVAATVGFYENDCNYRSISEGEDSLLLAETSNIGIKGRHVYLLTPLACAGN